MKLFSEAGVGLSSRFSISDHSAFLCPLHRFTGSQVPGLKSPTIPHEGVSISSRMILKSHLQEDRKLPEVYHANLGGGFDGRCLCGDGVMEMRSGGKSLQMKGDRECLQRRYGVGDGRGILRDLYMVCIFSKKWMNLLCWRVA